MNVRYVSAVTGLVVLVGAGAFYGGAAYEKSSLSSQGLLRSGTSNGANFQRGSGPDGQPGQRIPGQRPSRNGGGNFIMGEVLSKDDKSITIKTQDGSSRVVYFSGSTMIGKATAGSIDDVTNGEQVTVGGTSNPDGSLSAQNIQIRPIQQ